MDETWVAGVDGCKDGWVAVFIPIDGNAAPYAIFETRFVDIIDAQSKPAVIAIDMPIGLPDRIEGPGRVAEQAVRPWLRRKGSSVFSIPSRSAIYAEETASLEEAKRIARDTSMPPKAFTLQARGIFKKIREIDRLLKERPSLKDRVCEIHPEVAFWKLNSECVLLTSKKKAAGRAERCKLLARAGIAEELLTQKPPGTAKQDDFLDAIVSAIVAHQIYNGNAHPFPEPIIRDAFEIPIAIWV